MPLIHELIKIKFFALAIIIAIPLFSAGQETKSAVSDSLGYVRLAGPSSVIGELENAENSEALIPAIKVKLTYTGTKKITIPWDNNFGYILWDGNLVMQSIFKKLRESTNILYSYRTIS